MAPANDGIARETANILADVATAATRELPRHAAVTVAGALLLGLLLGGGAHAGAMAFEGLQRSDVSTQDLTWAFELLAGCVAFVCAWSVLSTVQRGVVIAIDAASPSAAGLGGHDVGAVPIFRMLGMGLVFGVLDVVNMCVALMATRDDSGQPRIGLCGAAVFGTWWLMRAFFGIATAVLVARPDGVLRALRRSGSDLFGYRFASLASRAPLVLFGATEIGLASSSAGRDDTLVLTTAAVFGAIVTTLDGLIESAWYRRLHPSVDPDGLVKVFE